MAPYAFCPRDHKGESFGIWGLPFNWRCDMLGLTDLDLRKG